MEKHQIQLQNFEKNEYKLLGVWDKSWVRPFESLWSILNTYRTVNVIRDHATLRQAIGINSNSRIVNEYFTSYGIFCNISNNKNNIDSIISNLVPEWYKEQIVEFTSKKDISEFFSDKIRYCPECMKSGYHSIVHQLKGINKCPFHKNISLSSYLKQRYVFGIQAPYKHEHKSSTRVRAFVSLNMSLYRKDIDFEDIAQIPLPLDRKEIPEIANFFDNNGLRNDFDYIKPIGADLFDKNIIPRIGTFLLNKELKPEIVITDIEEADKLIIQKINAQISKNNLKYRISQNRYSRMSFKYIYLQLFILEKLKAYTPDEIDYKCYQIERGKFISYSDELGMILLYLLFLTGDERIEDSLSDIRKTNDIGGKYALEFEYYPSDVCIHELDISDFCIAAQYYVLNDYINANFSIFKEYIKPLKGIEKPINRRDLILYPAHMIYVEKENSVEIYRY